MVNLIKKIGYRVFQVGVYIGMPFLPWRKPELLVGADSILSLPAFVKAKGLSSVLIVTGPTVSKMGLLSGLYSAMDKEGLKYTVYDKTIPNPTLENIEEAYVMYRANACEGIIAFGGGSALDCGKGVAAKVARPKKTVPQMKGLLKIMRKTPPLFAVPTTAGSGSEVTVAAVVSNSKTHEKYAISDPALIPSYAVLDPKLLFKLPASVTSTTGMDALTHAVEAYVGRANTKETREAAEKATKLVFENLKKSYDEPENSDARLNMLYASFYSGVAFTRAYVGYVHAISHALSGFYGVSHGLANAIILPYVLDYYGSSVHKSLAKLADAAGIGGANEAEKAKNFIQAIRDLNASMKIPDKIAAGTIKEADIPLMVSRALAEANPLYPVPKFIGAEEMAEIYRKIKVD